MDGRDAFRGLCLSSLTTLAEAGKKRDFFIPPLDICNFSSNDYLGLRSCPQILEAGNKAALCYGVGGGASRSVLASDNSLRELEEFIGAQYADNLTGEKFEALYLNSGFLANLAFFDALAPHTFELREHPRENWCLFVEKSSHSSLHAGAKLSQLPVHYFSQSNITQLERILKSSDARFKILVCESLHSMDGAFANLTSLCEVAARHGAMVFIDEAHSFGVFGKSGMGLVSQLPTELHKVVVGFMCGMGKSPGGNGGVLVMPEWLRNRAIQKSRSLIYSTAASPFSTGALLKSLKIIFGVQGDKLRALLFKNIALFEREFMKANCLLGDLGSPIKAIVLGSEKMAQDGEKFCLQKGFVVKAIRPPTVPKNTSRLRIVINAKHTESEIIRLCKTLTSLV